jgi:diguanylate cyclase (GGDEF)-like protein
MTARKIMPNEIVSFDKQYRHNADSMLSEGRRFHLERALRMPMENPRIATVRYDRNFCRIYASPSYLQIIVSERAADILGKSVDELWWPTNISAKAYRALLEEVMLGGRESDVTLEWTDGDGRLVSYLEKLVPEYDTAGEIAGVSVLMIDVSVLRRQQMVENHRQRVFERLAHGDDLAGVLKQIALYVESAKPGVYCSILVLDEEQTHLQTAVAPTFPSSCKKMLDSWVSAGQAGCCDGWDVSAVRAERVIVEDFSKQPRSRACRKLIREMGAAACWSEPIFSSSRQLLGALRLYLKQAGRPDQDDTALLLQAAQLSALSIERKRLEQQIYSQACYDPLTHLPNRRLFGNRLHEEIVKAERGAYGLAVLFIDLDHFKEINDTWGHEAGDGVLVEAAQRIQACVRESDTVARLGGDEFVIILPEVGNTRPFERVAQNIVSVMGRPFYYAAHDATVSASIGIAIYPVDATHPEALIHCADMAMYAAKETGGNTYSIFSRGLSESERRRLQLSNDLRDALGKGQFEVYYQPIFDVCSGRIVKAEALLRWHHPELGAVPLDQFIPIAEETDTILEIGDWVFREAVDTAKRWKALTQQPGPKQISVNMSARQFTSDRGGSRAIEYLQAAGLDPAHIAIEITEGLLLNHFPRLAGRLESLHALGIEISLDDFGSGISALSNLKKANIDYLKIDRSVIQGLETDPDQRAMVEAMVVMAQRLGLKVIAEGVETVGQGALLAAVGCELQQGYLYSHPLPADAFLAFVKRPKVLAVQPMARFTGHRGPEGGMLGQLLCGAENIK